MNLSRNTLNNHQFKWIQFNFKSWLMRSNETSLYPTQINWIIDYIYLYVHSSVLFSVTLHNQQTQIIVSLNKASLFVWKMPHLRFLRCFTCLSNTYIFYSSCTYLCHVYCYSNVINQLREEKNPGEIFDTFFLTASKIHGILQLGIVKPVFNILDSHEIHCFR